MGILRMLIPSSAADSPSNKLCSNCSSFCPSSWYGSICLSFYTVKTVNNILAVRERISEGGAYFLICTTTNSDSFQEAGDNPTLLHCAYPSPGLINHALLFPASDLPVLYSRKEMKHWGESAVPEPVVAADKLIARGKEDGWIVIMYYLMNPMVNFLPFL